MTPQEEVSLHYDKITEGWRYLLGENFHYGVFDSPGQPLADATLALTQLMAEHARFEAGGSVLDLGCGIGEPAIYLVTHHDVSVVGVSISAEGIARANERAALAKLSAKLNFFVADALNVPMADAIFDHVWVMESAHLMPDKERLLREAFRLLRPSGTFVLCDIMRRRDLPLMEVLKRAREFHLLNEVFGSAKVESLAGFSRLASEAGLVVDVELDLTAKTRPTFSAWKRNLDVNRNDVERTMGHAATSAFDDACRILTSMWDDGTLGYGLIAGRKV
jgi:27-O-demethylrifamycin SV methyltransferase